MTKSDNWKRYISPQSVLRENIRKGGGENMIFGEDICPCLYIYPRPIPLSNSIHLSVQCSWIPFDAYGVYLWYVKYIYLSSYRMFKCDWVKYYAILSLFLSNLVWSVCWKYLSNICIWKILHNRRANTDKNNKQYQNSLW